MILIRRCSESPFPTLLILTLGYGVAELLQTDYSGGGVLLIALLYLCREKRVLQFAMIAFISIFLFGGVNALATVAILPIALYNGERGIRFKYVFYWFYPAHLLLFALLAGIMA